MLRYAEETIKFHGMELNLTRHLGQYYVAVRPIIEDIGLSWCKWCMELEELKRHFGMTVRYMEIDEMRYMHCIPAHEIDAWLASLDATGMEENVKNRLLLYQKGCENALNWAGAF